MLLELMVENYAVVEHLRLRFGPGLNVLTGETGSGKSIIVDALGLLLGARASADMLRTGAARARIAGIFEVHPDAAAAAGVELEDGELLVEREILAGGKSRAFIGNRPVTAAALRELAPLLGDIHGQHDQQQLFDASAQLALLDEFAACRALREQTGALYRDWRNAARELDELDRSAQEKLRLLDLWTFQRNEIEAAQLAAGEDAELANERRVLQNVSKLSDGANAAYSALYDAEDSVYAHLRTAMRRIEELTRYDESLSGVHETLKPALIAVDEASGTLRDYLGRLEADPGRLDEVETRLAGIEKLKRKYGATVEEILAFLETVREGIAATENSTERRAALERQRAELGSRYQAAAAQLSHVRRQAAETLERQVEAELRTVAMERTAFKVELSRAEWGATGFDAARFLVSPNLGEEPRPLEKVASGGELSRIALSLKNAVSSGGPAGAAAALPRTLVFDEVDAGIGGTAADSVGRRLKQLASSAQVLCVTHLAQIAGYADRHYAVEKREAKGRTLATVEELTGDTRVRELSRMLSGRVTPEALKHAEQLIRAGAAH